MQRNWVRYSGLCTVLACLLGLGWARAAVGAEGAGPITLYFWESPGGYPSTGDLIQDFERLHDGRDGRPAIHVIAGQSAEIDLSGDSQRLLCSIAGGDPADVVFFARHAVGEWAARGAFISMQPFLDRDLAERPDDEFTVHREQFYPACWEEASYQRQLYALPLDTDNRALYYNLDYLERYADKLKAIGCVDPADPTQVGPPRTWAQLKECTRILSEYSPDGKLQKAGFIPNYGNSWLYLYGWLNGGKYLSADGQTCTLNSPPIVDALVYMTELYDLMGGADEVYRFQSTMQSGDLDPFLTGKVAMKIDGNWFMPGIANLRPDLRFGVALAPSPEGKPSMGWCGGWSYIIPTGAKHPEASWEFMKYLASPRAAEIRLRALVQAAQAGGLTYIPPLHARIDVTQWTMDHFLYSNPAVDDKFKKAMHVFVDSMPISKFRPVTPVGQLLWNEHVRAMEAGIFKRYDANDIRRNAQLALDASTEVVQKELDRLYHPVPYPTLSWKPIVAGYLLLLVVSVMGIARFFRRRGTPRCPAVEVRAAYGFVLPWFLGFAVFGGGPIVFSLLMSFCSYDVFSPPQFVGLKNYLELIFSDNLFYVSLGNTLFMALGVPLTMAVSLAIALLLNYEVRGMPIYRTFFYLPAIMPAVAASILWIWILNPEEGILNSMLHAVGVAGPAWLQDQRWSKPALILMGLWGAGGGMIVWLAGLKGIPRHLYEAAEIDGAGRLRRFWNITLPMLSPYILFNLIMGLIGTFQIFTQAYVMTQGGPLDSTLFYAYALFNNAFRYMKMGYASAMAWVLFAIVLILTMLQLRLSKGWVHYESEK